MLNSSGHASMSNSSGHSKTLEEMLQEAIDRIADLESDVYDLDEEQAAGSISPPPAPPQWAPPPSSPEASFPTFLLPLIIISVLLCYACWRLGVPALMKRLLKGLMGLKPIIDEQSMSIVPAPAQDEGFAGSPGVASAREEEIRQKRSTDKQRLLEQIAGLSNGGAPAPSPADVEEDVQWHPNAVGGLDAALSAERGSNLSNLRRVHTRCHLATPSPSRCQHGFRRGA